MSGAMSLAEVKIAVGLFLLATIEELIKSLQYRGCLKVGRSFAATGLQVISS